MALNSNLNFLGLINMKTFTLFASFFLMALLSFSTLAAQSNLEQAIQHSQQAANSDKGKMVAEHAEEAKKFANAAKGDTDRVINSKELDKGIKCLTDAIEEGQKDNTDAAKKAAKDAVEHFRQAAK